ncbi:hypothetical protein NA57DRAFT_61801 [Rhizodiscina lignyota]|uniref:GAR domain-containing protein n=1 Tax=Rhizodiscina lignyota TaxID=1504668 RepID=A0A9P4I6E6_9PEZI|nr:hypothetical protein NA57DRAFT_61801 [Rhizodiscina lignyota]
MAVSIDEPPFLAAPQSFARPNRSPASSPTRHGRNKSQTIRLIRDISPSTALRAFDGDGISLGNTDDVRLQLHLSSLSASERDLGTRIAIAAQKLRAWCDEIEQWGWSGTFEVDEDKKRRRWRWPSQDEAKTVANIEKRLSEISAEPAHPPTDGTIPRAQVEQYGRRLDEIGEELEDLEIDELKDQVLGIHRTRSRPGSSYSGISVTNLMMMDDFSILVTHTLMQSLPYLGTLRHHMDTWTIRLNVLSEVPQFVAELRQSQRSIRLGWDAVLLARDPSSTNQGLTLEAHKHAVALLQNVLQQKVWRLGHTLDKMLDALESREDKLPDAWIDDFEALEADYGKWVTEAQRSVLELELSSFQVKTKIHWVPQKSSAETEGYFSGVTRRASERSGRNASSIVILNPQPQNGHTATPGSPPTISQTVMQSPIGMNRRARTPSSASLVGHTTTPSPPPQNGQERTSSPSSQEEHTTVSGPPSRLPPLTPPQQHISHARTFSSASTTSQTSQRSSRALRIEIPSAHSTEGPNDGRMNLPAEEMTTELEPQVHSAESRAAANEPSFEGRVRRASLTSMRSISSVEIKRIQVHRSPNTSLPNSPLKGRHSLSQDEPHTPITPLTVERRHSEGNTPVSPIHRSRASSLLHSPSTPLATTQEEPALLLPPTHHPEIVWPSPSHQGDRQSHHATVEATTPQSPIAPVSPQNTIRDEQGLIPKLAEDSSEEPEIAASTPVIVRPSTPTAVESPSSVYSEDQASSMLDTPTSPDSPSKRTLWKPHEGSLNAAMAKRRTKFKEGHMVSSNQRHVSAPLSDNTSARTPNPNRVQDLDQQISNILTTLPTPIKLTTNRRTSAQHNLSAAPSITRNRPSHRRSRAPSLTLARAPTPLPTGDDPSPHNLSHRSSRKSLNPETEDIKLYHLMSSSRPGMPPIKLFIRRVGENGERVMVRVGGGWADLGEYLRQYAEHHGRRAVSDSLSNVDVVEMERVDARPGSKDGPESIMGTTSRRTSMGTPISGGGPGSGPAVDSPMLSSSPVSFSALTATPEPQTAREVSVPGVTPQSAQSAGSTASRRSWGGDEVGLAGPKARRVELSDEKKDWIEGMVERARKANDAAGGKENEGFASIGKAGATKRVYMKG